MINYKLKKSDLNNSNAVYVWSEQLKVYVKGRKKDIVEALELGRVINDYRKVEDNFGKYIFIR